MNITRKRTIWRTLADISVSVCAVIGLAAMLYWTNPRQLDLEHKIVYGSLKPI